MPTVLQWLFELLIRERPRSADERDLTAALWVGGAEDDLPITADFALEAPGADEAEAMLRALLRVGSVGQVWIATGPMLSPGQARRLLRFARRLRPLGLNVRLASPAGSSRSRC